MRSTLRGVSATTELPQSHSDLLDAQVATLGTLDPQGRPQLTEVWFLYDDGELKLSLNETRAKTRNLRQRPHCSLLILDLLNPYRYLEVRGRARLEPDPGGAFAAKLHAKYGADPTAYDRPGDTRVVATIEPETVHAVDMSG
jgi:PPOX class probable F420-dependent enzyme